MSYAYVIPMMSMKETRRTEQAGFLGMQETARIDLLFRTIIERLRSKKMPFGGFSSCPEDF